MRVTSRGIGVVAIVVFSLAQGYVFGERVLNYVAAPALAALAIGGLMLYQAKTPTIDRSTIRPGFLGEQRHETITIKGSGVATITDTLPAGIEGEVIERTVSLPFKTDRELKFRERGIYTFDPVQVHQRDPLGLVATTVEFDTQNEVVIYPEIFELDRIRVIGAYIGGQLPHEGQSFERLREYQDGDPLQRVHWKSMAKHGELLVADFVSDQQTESVHIVVDGRPAMADDLAAAAASLVSLFDDENFNVSVTIPDNKGANGRSQRHRGNVLRALASIDEHSTWDDTSKQYHLKEEIHDQADVLILGGADSMTVRIGEEEFSFDELLSESESTSRDVRIYSTPATTQSVTDS